MQTTLTALVEGADGSRKAIFVVDRLVIAGWTARDVEAMEHHIKELEAMGIARPRQTPTYYALSPSRLTQGDRLQELGTDSSGEAEPVLVSQDGELYLGLGSDHTDRKVEAYGVSVSKQLCDKPLGGGLWPLGEVKDHWDKLILRSHIVENGESVLYQEGTLANMRHPDNLIALYTGGGSLPDKTVMFCGTVPAIGGVRSSAEFSAELVDPVLGRSLSLSYAVTSLEIMG